MLRKENLLNFFKRGMVMNYASKKVIAFSSKVNMDIFGSSENS